MRGREVSRIEGFSDAVFGFSLTLLVVSLDVPKNFADLRAAVEGFPAFAVTFAVICWIWYEHYAFFRAFALRDGFTIFLNSLLLFVVMFFVYPLKFIFSRLITGTLLGLGPGIGVGMTAADGRMLMQMYSGGFVALFAIFALLHWNAWRRRTLLDLTALEAFDARAGVRAHTLTLSLGAVSLLMAAALPIDYLAWSGLLFFLLGPVLGVNGYLNGRARDRLEAST